MGLIHDMQYFCGDTTMKWQKMYNVNNMYTHHQADPYSKYRNRRTKAHTRFRFTLGLLRIWAKLRRINDTSKHARKIVQIRNQQERIGQMEVY